MNECKCDNCKHCFEEKKENKKVKYCYFCGASRPEFTVASKHLSYMLERCKKFDSGTSHITVHICEDCFLKIFDKEQNNDKLGMGK